MSAVIWLLIKLYAKYRNLLLFLLWEFIEEVLVTFVAIVFFFFVDTISATNTVSSHSVAEVLAILFKYLPFSQTNVLGLQL